MKYMILGIAILAVLLSLSLLFDFLSGHYLSAITELLHSAADYLPAEDWDSLLALTEDAEEYWDDRRSYFCSLLDHNELEDIDRTLTSLLAYERTQEPVCYYETYNRLVSMLEHIQNMDMLKIYNILTPVVNHRTR